MLPSPLRPLRDLSAEQKVHTYDSNYQVPYIFNIDTVQSKRIMFNDGLNPYCTNQFNHLHDLVIITI